MPEASLLPYRNGNLSDNYDGLDYIAARMTCQSGRTHEKESGDMSPMNESGFPSSRRGIRGHRQGHGSS